MSLCLFVRYVFFCCLYVLSKEEIKKEEEEYLNMPLDQSLKFSLLCQRNCY